MTPLRLFALLAASSLCASLVAAPRVTFERTIPPPASLGGATDLAVVYAIGDSPKISVFLDAFIEQSNQSGTLRVHDVTSLGRYFSGQQIDPAGAKKVRAMYPADAFIRVGAFRCQTADRAGDGNSYDANGKRIRRPHRYVDAVCEARLEVMNGTTLARVSTFKVVGEGTSPRVDRITPEESEVALDQAARYAAVTAAEQITPRKIRETIVLIENAPKFGEGLAMIEAGRPEAARRIWEKELKRDSSSAALRFNLAAVCEAAGDITAAAQHYTELQKLAPKERRYKDEYAGFRRRNGLK